MPRAKKQSTEVSSPASKAKTLFDHINEIRIGKNPNYFETLSDGDKKSWSNYMVCRFLSMQPELIEDINELQRYSNVLQPKEFYKILIQIVPKGRAFYPYVKSKSEKYNPKLLSLLSSHFQDSEKNVTEYITLLTKGDLENIVKKYGYADKQIKELLET